MKRILITNASSRHNRGDSAILRGQITLLQEAYPAAKIRVLSLDPFSEAKLKGVNFIPSLIYWAMFETQVRNSLLKKLARTIFIAVIVPIVVGLSIILGKKILKVLPKKVQNILREYYSAGIICTIGGGYLRSNKKSLQEMLNLVLLCEEFLLGKMFGKRVVVFPASVGPFKLRIHEWWVMFSLMFVDFVIVRENFSYELVKKYLGERSLALSGDLAFLAGKRTTESRNDNRLLVGITVRQWFAGKKQSEFESSIAKFIERHPEADFILVPQVTSELFDDDDRVVSARVFNRLKVNKNVQLMLEDLSLQQVQALIGRCDVFMGMRMHSNIFALLEKVPVIALAYEYKTQGIMDDFGLSEWVIPVEKVTVPQLERLFTKVRSAKSRMAYKKTINIVLPGYKKDMKSKIKEILKLDELSVNRKKKILSVTYSKI